LRSITQIFRQRNNVWRALHSPLLELQEGREEEVLEDIGEAVEIGMDRQILAKIEHPDPTTRVDVFCRDKSEKYNSLLYQTTLPVDGAMALARVILKAEVLNIEAAAAASLHFIFNIAGTYTQKELDNLVSSSPFHSNTRSLSPMAWHLRNSIASPVRRLTCLARLFDSSSRRPFLSLSLFSLI